MRPSISPPVAVPTPNRAHLRERELAERWGVSPRTLQRWRLCGDGPTYAKFGRSVSYPLHGPGGVLDWETRFLYRSTSERAHFHGEQ